MAREWKFTVTLTPRTALLVLATGLITSLALELGSETMTMTTTYPSPVGIYRTIVTTSNTDLARDVNGAIVTVGKNSGANLTVNGKVGVGTQSPATLLDVNGASTFRGSITIPTGAADKLVLTSDPHGNATWQQPASGNGGSGFYITYRSGTCWLPNPYTQGCSCPGGAAPFWNYTLAGGASSGGNEPETWYFCPGGGSGIGTGTAPQSQFGVHGLCTMVGKTSNAVGGIAGFPGAGYYPASCSASAPAVCTSSQQCACSSGYLVMGVAGTSTVARELCTHYTGSVCSGKMLYVMNETSYKTCFGPIN